MKVTSSSATTAEPTLTNVNIETLSDEEFLAYILRLRGIRAALPSKTREFTPPKPKITFDSSKIG